MSRTKVSMLSLGLMLFSEPAKALAAVKRALKPGGKMAVVVFTTPAANPFMAKPMQILLRHAGKAPPLQGQPGIFSLGAVGVLERLFTDTVFMSRTVQRRAVRGDRAAHIFCSAADVIRHAGVGDDA